MAQFFEIQDGTTPTSTANSYVSLADFDQWIEDRAYVTTRTDAEKQAALILATEFLDIRFNYKGYKKTLDQSTEWPRSDVADKAARLILGVPAAVELATSSYAWIALEQVLVSTPTPTASGQVLSYERMKVEGGVEEEKHYGNDGQASGGVVEYPIGDGHLIRAGLTVNGSDIQRA